MVYGITVDSDVPARAGDILKHVELAGDFGDVVEYMFTSEDERSNTVALLHAALPFEHIIKWEIEP